MHRLLLALLGVFTSVGLAQADIVHLKNGSKLEGTVVSKTEKTVTIRVKHGGKMTLPCAHVARVVTAEDALATYGDRAAETNMNDPASIERLALWCSKRGMGKKTKQLTTMARGLRLEQMILRARNSESAKTWVDIFHWARACSLDDEILLWILDQGRKLDPADSALRLAYQRFQRDLSERAQRVRFLAELRSRPRYAMPSRHLPAASLGSLSADALRAQHAKKREELRKSGPSLSEKERFLEEARQARLKETELRSGVVKDKNAWQRRALETYRRAREEEEERLAREEAARWARERERSAGND